MNNFHEEVMNDFLAPRKDGKYELEIPCLTEGRKLVNRKDGFSWGVVMGIRILLRVIHLNHEYGEGWTKWDFLDIAEWVLKYNVENPESFKDSVNTITLWLDDKWDLINRLSTYEEKVESLESYLTGEFENLFKFISFYR